MQTTPKDTDLFPFGKHAGKTFKDVPASYLLWLWTEPSFQTERNSRQVMVADYIRANMAALAKECPSDDWKGAGVSAAEREINRKTAYERTARRLATCVHFNGAQNGKCNAGVPYDMWAKLPNQEFRPLPCLPPFRPGVVQPCEDCPKYQAHTQAEIDQSEVEIAESTSKIMLARNAIVAHTNGKPGQGKTTCPNCNGVLSFSIAACNGHIHARCSNPDCVRWME